MCIDIYVSTYAYIYTETDQDNKYFIIHCLLFYQHHFFTQRPFCPPLYFVSVLLWDVFFLLFWGWHCFSFGLTFVFVFLGRRRTNTFKTIFLLVIKFIKIHGIQLLLLRVTLSLDGYEILDWVKPATVQVWIHLPGKIPIWTIPYCISTQKPIAVSGSFSWALICWASNQTWRTATFFYSFSSVLSHC